VTWRVCDTTVTTRFADTATRYASRVPVPVPAPVAPALLDWFGAFRTPHETG
jgi:hypothetical protein